MSRTAKQLDELYREFVESHEFCNGSRLTASHYDLVDRATAALAKLVAFVSAYRKRFRLKSKDSVCGGEKLWQLWAMAECELEDLRGVVARAIPDSMQPTAYAEVARLEDAIKAMLYGPWSSRLVPDLEHELFLLSRRWHPFIHFNQSDRKTVPARIECGPLSKTDWGTVFAVDHPQTVTKRLKEFGGRPEGGGRKARWYVPRKSLNENQQATADSMVIAAQNAVVKKKKRPSKPSR